MFFIQPPTASRGHFWIFGILFTPLLFFVPAASAQEEAPLSCQQQYWTAFDQIDITFQKKLVENLDSVKATKLTGSDAVEIFASSIGTYNCQLKMACQMVLRVPEKSERFPFPECGDELSGYDANGELILKPATVGNALEIFQVPGAFGACHSAENSVSPNSRDWEACEELRRAKVTMAMAQLSSSLKESAAEKRAGFLLSKFQALHERLNPEGGGGLVDLVSDFVQKFKKVLAQICTTPLTETRP